MTDPIQEIRTDSQWLRIQRGPVDVAQHDAFLRHARCGGVGIFLGTTRRVTDERETTHLEYDCYPEMAIRVMQELADHASSEFGALKVTLVHRIGSVAPEEASVLVGAATPHRKAAFEAARYLIDELKRTVPIWKKERYADGTEEWVGDPRRRVLP